MRKTLFSLFLVAIVLLGFTSQPMAALTISNEVAQVWGGKNVKIFDIAFDSSYAYGGESLTKASRRISALDHCVILPKAGYTFEYDETNEKVKVFAPAPAVIYEEKQTIATSAITLDYPAAFIMAVVKSGGTDYQLVDAGATLVSDQCKLTSAMAAGTRTGLTFATGNSGVVLVTYVTQAWKDVWDNLVQSETVTISSNTGALAYNAIAVQSISGTGTGGTTNYYLFDDKDDTGVVAEVEVDWTPTGNQNTDLTFADADDVTSAEVTYIKKPSTGFLVDNWVEEETASLQSGTSGHCLDFPILLWGYSGQVPINGQTTQALIASHQAMTDMANVGYILWGNAVSFPSLSGSTAYVPSIVTEVQVATTTATYVKGVPGQIPGLIPLEVRNTSNLATLTGVQVIMIGR